jgi:hypothetical protein
MAGTKFSDYLGLKHYKKAKKIKHFNHLDLAYRPQSLSTYHNISPTVNSRHCLKKYVPVHRGAFCQLPFWWIYYCHSSIFTGKDTGKTHLCAVQWGGYSYFGMATILCSGYSALLKNVKGEVSIPSF